MAFEVYYAAMLVVPLLVCWLPIALTLWFRRKALAAPAEARASVWFWCFRFLRYLNLGTIALWWIATDSMGLKYGAKLFWIESPAKFLPAGEALFLVCFWIPPALVLVLCQVLFQPVYSRIREVHWTRAELARQAALGLTMGLFPILCVTGGFLELGRSGRFMDFILSYAAAAILWIGSAIGIRKHFQLTPNALTTGELRDRAFALAAQARVKLRQLYLLPPGRARLANAFARSGNNILLTEALLTSLSKREVDCVIGHELSHLKHDHPRLLGFALLGGFAVVAVPYFIFSQAAENWRPLFDLLFMSVPLLSFYFVARRFEYTADAGAAKLTGDPAAMITGLVKLHRLNLMPLDWGRWSEKTLTHPSTQRRAQAIGRAFGLSDSRVRELLQTSANDGEAAACEHYPLPGFAAASGKEFSTLFKRSTASRSLLAYGALAILLPAAVLRAIDMTGAFGGSGSAAFLSALVICCPAALASANFLPFVGYRGLCRRLRAKFAKTPEAPAGEDVAIVGLSPGDTPRIFEANYSWDAGCLGFGQEQVTYVGEEMRFTLRREQIVSVCIGPGIPGWFRSKFLYITWRWEPGRPEFTFNLRPIEVSSVLAMNRALLDLQRRFEEWRAAVSPLEQGSSASQNAPAFPPPYIGKVTSSAVSSVRNPRQILTLVLFVAFASGITASFLKLPIEWIAPLYIGPSDPSAGVSGWCAVLISLIVLFLFFGPAWFAKRERTRVQPIADVPPSLPVEDSSPAPPST